MTTITKNCRLTGKPFQINDEDRVFYAKMGVFEPTLCPQERERRRSVWRNERHLFTSNCSLCKKIIITMYDAQKNKFPIYCHECFWNDEWDPLHYGQEIDFNRTFFEQFEDLMQVVPRIFLFTGNSINSEYTLNSIWNKNCYLTSGADYNEDCFYGINSQHCKNCADMYFIFESERSYGCIDCHNVYQCIACQDSEQLSDCWFLYDCKNCKNCAFSSNLRNKEYVLFNQQLNEEEYEYKLEQILSHLFDNPNWLEDNLKLVRNKALHRSSKIINCENCSGNNLKNCRNAHECYDSANLQDCKYVNYSVDAGDSYDLSCAGWKGSLLYEVSSAGDKVYNVKFSNAVINSNDVSYSASIWNSSNVFGSISLHKNKYVILNRQYDKREYEKISAKLIEHMKKTGEWGEFFPPSLSPFAYNRSMAIDHLPLNEEQALAYGYKWYKEEQKYTEEQYEDFLSCLDCKNPYRPIKQELNFYSSMRIPIPKYCWACRLKKLLNSRKPRKLLEGLCNNCGTSVKAAFRPEAKDLIYCEECYLQAVY